MALNERGFAVVELPRVDESFLATFEDLPLDQYCGGEHRYRRFSQYRIRFEDDRWAVELLPHRPFYQSKSYNRLVGGIARHFEPLQIDPSPQIDRLSRDIPLDTNTEWQVNVHQCRVISRPGIRGISVPEGPHRDGHEYGAIAVFSRHEIRGGETSLMPTGGGEPFFLETIEPGHALVYEDGRMFHYTSDIEAVDGAGHRDLWIVAFNPWSERKYGPEFEAAARD